MFAGLARRLSVAFAGLCLQADAHDPGEFVLREGFP